MRVLHVAALPFPSPQGTQGLLHAMLMAQAEAGHDAHLLCYPGAPLDVPYTVHRCGPPRAVSQRSGPSWQKLSLDGALARALRKLGHFDAIIAHHVEAAAIALALRKPAWFYAHTDLAAELPSYFPRQLGLPMGLAGALVDRTLSQRMPTFAVSPLLAQRLGGDVLPLPWPLPPPIRAEERRRARASWQLEGKRVALYAGNLDAYQGLASLVQAVARDESLHLLIATEAPIRSFARALHAFMGRVRFARLHDERARRAAYAACDFAVVPRAVPGGVPIKLFDALARNVPVVAQRCALAGYPLERFCTVIDREWHFEAVAHDARAYLGATHAPARFAAELSARACRPDAAPA